MSKPTLLLIGQGSGFTLHMQLTFVANTLFFDVKKVKKYIRMGINVFKIFIWGGIFLYIRL